MNILSAAFTPAIYNPVSIMDVIFALKLLSRIFVLLALGIITVLELYRLGIKHSGLKGVLLSLIPIVNIYFLSKLGFRKTWLVFALITLIVLLYINTCMYRSRMITMDYAKRIGHMSSPTLLHHGYLTVSI